MRVLFSRYYRRILVIFLTLYSIPVLFYISGVFTPSGAKDFHQFWYAGQFLLLGNDPYEAYFSGAALPMRQPGLAVTPSNSPPMLLALSFFSFLPWGTAKFVWLVINFVLVFACYRLVEHHLFFPGVSLTGSEKILILLIFFDLSPTRIAIENGQTTMLVFALMLLAILLADRSWLVAGVLLGLALSKFSVSLPALIFLILHRKYRPVMVAMLTQLLGFVVISLMSGNSILLIMKEYLNLVVQLGDQQGIHLAYLIPGSNFDMLLTGLMTFAVFIPLYYWFIKRRLPMFIDSNILDFYLLTILMIWALLVAYHRPYDALTLLLFIVLVFKSLKQTDAQALPVRPRVALVAVLATGIALLIFPARIAGFFSDGLYDVLNHKVPGLILLAFLMCSMYLLFRFLNQHLPTQGK